MGEQREASIRLLRSVDLLGGCATIADVVSAASAPAASICWGQVQSANEIYRTKHHNPFESGNLEGVAQLVEQRTFNP